MPFWPERTTVVFPLLLLQLLCIFHGSSVLASLSDSNKKVMRDVCVIGAGAGGMYSAILLRDRGYSVAVIEKNDHVGGHAVTYKQAGSDQIFDMGVRVHPNTPLVHKVYGRYGLELEKISMRSLNNVCANFETGEQFPCASANWFKVLWSLLGYDVLSKVKYNYLSKPGINLPGIPPDELVIPFATYLKNRHISSGFGPVINYLQGFGPFDKLLTLYALKNLRPVVINTILLDKFLAPKTGAQSLYQAMARDLGHENIFLNTQIGQTIRPDATNVVMFVNAPNEIGTFGCDQLVVSVPPMLSQLSFLDLDSDETKIFGQFKSNAYWSVLAELDGLKSKDLIFNANIHQPLQAPVLPGIYTIVPTPWPGIYNITLGSDKPLPLEAVNSIIHQGVDKLYKGKVTFKKLTLALQYSPYALHVDQDAIKHEFYRKLNDFQGYRNIFYVGAAFSTHDTVAVWEHAASIIEANFPAKK